MTDEEDALALALKDSPQVLNMPKASLSLVSRLAQEQIGLEAQIESLELQLKSTKEQLLRLSTIDLPTAMGELGLKNTTALDGSKITVKWDVAISVPAESKEESYDWLEAKDFGSLVKVEISLNFGKGELEDAKELYDKVRKLTNREVAFSRTVHPQTLRAWARDQLDPDKDVSERGVIPEGLFKTFEFSKAKVTLPKRK